MHCEKGAIADNLRQMQQEVNAAIERDLDFLCFPEMNITGYIDPTRQPEAILSLDSPEIEQVVALTQGNQLTLIAGLVEGNPAGKPFITQIVAQRGQLVGCYRKINVAPDEVEWFAPGAELPLFTHSKAKFGIAICADIDRASIFSESAQAGGQLIFEAAAPGLYGAQETRNWQSGFNWWNTECEAKLGRYAQENKVYIAVATQAGRTVDEDFPGGGYVFAPDGSCIAATPDGSPGVLYATLPL